jgi:hypothetical protein
MRLLAEGIGVVAGTLAIATYLGINVKQWLSAKKYQRKSDEENTDRKEP